MSHTVYSHYLKFPGTRIWFLQFFFICALVVSCVAFVLSLFAPHFSSPLFGASGRLCFVIMAFLGYPYIHIHLR